MADVVVQNLLEKLQYPPSAGTKKRIKEKEWKTGTQTIVILNCLLGRSENATVKVLSSLLT